MLRELSHDIGSFEDSCCLVKTIVRISHFGRFQTPHTIRPKAGCLWDEAELCPKVNHTSFRRRPATSNRAFVLHLKCRTLLDYALKKSITGRADEPGKCLGCWAGLDETTASYNKSCEPSRFMHRLKDKRHEHNYSMDALARRFVRAQEALMAPLA